MNSIGSSNITDACIAQADLAPNSVGSAQIQTDAVDATEIADGAIDSGEIFDNSLFASDLAPGSVGTSELAASAVDSSKVANNSLTTADIAGTDASGSISLPAAAVANGRCNQYSITVGGAEAGDVVLISAQAAVQNGVLLYGSRVPSNGTATLNVCNFSGVAMVAIDDLPIRTITFG